MKNTRYSQRGLTLIELMISMLLGLFLIGGILQILSSTKQSSRLQEGLSRLQENGRFAMNFITKDVRMAGFLGCRRIADIAPTSVANAPIVLATVNNVVTGNDSVANNWNANACGGTNSCIAGTDTVTVIHATSCGANLTAAMVGASTVGTGTIAIPATNTCGIAVDDPLILADCASSVIFRASNTTNAITHTATNNTSADLSKAYPISAELFTYNANSYYIRTSAGDPNLNSLWRYDNNRAASGTNPVELIEGVQDMQILYGADTDATPDGSANYYVPAGTAGLDMSKVVSVRASLLVVSADDNLVAQPVPYTYNLTTSTPTDRRIRRVLTSTIAVRNLLR